MYFIRDYDGPKPFKGSSNPDVLLLGQDPTVDQNIRFSVVLGLKPSKSPCERESFLLQNYVFNKILRPLGIDRARIIATNLVNAYYYNVPNIRIAKQYRDLIVSTAKKAGISTTKFPSHTNGAILHALNFHVRTKRDFEKLLESQTLCHIITLGEPVFQVLRESYNLDLDSKIKDVLKKLLEKGHPPTVCMCNKRISLLPLPHIFNESNPKWQFYTRIISGDLKRLKSFYNQK